MERDNKLPIVRLLSGIRNFGYTFEAAILDIIDNSIVAKATEIRVILESEETKAPNTLKRIVIKDNGKGMNIDEIYNALFLGSPNSKYEENSLSKYGFGLKSAGLSLGNNVEVISRKKPEDEWKRSQINWHTFEYNNDYVVNENLPVSEMGKYTKGYENGTIVLVDDLLDINAINANKAVKKLRNEIAIVFHRFIEGGIHIYVDEEEVKAFDPLFCNEITGVFSDYDGKAPKSFWDKDKVIPVDTKTKAKAEVKAVVLPIPALFKAEGKRKDTEKKYHMAKSTVGFYIYRNKRLIKYGVTLGLVDRYHGCFHIRIRIDLNSNCDPFINLDVKKTELYFGEDFMERLANKVNPFINRAKELWETLQNKQDSRDDSQADLTHSRSNRVLSSIKPVDCDPSTLDVKVMEQSIETHLEEIKQEYGNEEDIVEQLKLRYKDRVVAVDSLSNDLLWKPSTREDGSSDIIVLLSREHPFYQKIYKNLEPGSDAIVILDALFLSMAMSELGISSTDTATLSKIFKRLRQSVSFQLTNLCDIIIDTDEGLDDEN